MSWGKGGEPYHSYYSTLSPQEIRTRLMTRGTVVQGRFDHYSENRRFVKFLPDGRFCILVTGGFGTLRNQHPFIGTAAPEGDGSRITGDFLPEKGRRQGIGVFVVLFLLVFVLCNWVTGALWVSLAAALVWSIFFGCFLCVLWMFAPMLCRPTNLLTLKFIEENLLEE